ncbi:SRPBCC family protein [Crossiella equi]|uniref:SRPBCC family protein n=1 Tax=Crossiella equi TaxID=130796 RepID=UPI00201198DE|nr:SRPBCC family protein [Crossiella equi]
MLRFERHLKHSPRKVWRAVTDPAHLKHWFPAEFQAEQRIGAPIRFVFAGDAAPPGTGRVLEYDAPRVFAFTWQDANSTDVSVLRFELVPKPDGCLLVFTHALGGPGDLLVTTARHAAGWDGCLDVLEGLLAGHEHTPTMTEWFHRAEAYVARFGLATGESTPTPDGHLVRLKRDLVQPADGVWTFLTADTPPALGTPPPLPTTHGYQPAGPTTALEAPHRLTYLWLHEQAPAGEVHWHLTPQPSGCLLEVTQTIPRALPHLRAITLAAWQTHLELLFAALHGDIRCPWPADRTEELRKHYAKTLPG